MPATLQLILGLRWRLQSSFTEVLGAVQFTIIICELTVKQANHREIRGEGFEE
jgi:hypothetical protein